MDVFLSSQKSCKVISNEFLIAFFCHNSLCQLYYVVIVGFFVFDFVFCFVFLGGGCLQPVGCLFVQSHCSFFCFLHLQLWLTLFLEPFLYLYPLTLGLYNETTEGYPEKKI